MAETGQREGESAANSNPSVVPDELEQYAKNYIGGRRITNWDAYFTAFREAYNERAPKVVAQRAEAARQAGCFPGSGPGTPG